MGSRHMVCKGSQFVVLSVTLCPSKMISAVLDVTWSPLHSSVNW